MLVLALFTVSNARFALLRAAYPHLSHIATHVDYHFADVAGILTTGYIEGKALPSNFFILEFDIFSISYLGGFSIYCIYSSLSNRASYVTIACVYELLLILRCPTHIDEEMSFYPKSVSI